MSSSKIVRQTISFHSERDADIVEALMAHGDNVSEFVRECIRQSVRGEDELEARLAGIERRVDRLVHLAELDEQPAARPTGTGRTVTTGALVRSRPLTVSTTPLS